MLLQELGDASDPARPLRRRTLLLLGQWVSKLSPDDRQLMYQAATQLLADSDAAVQLAAIDCLHALIDDWCVQSHAPTSRCGLMSSTFVLKLLSLRCALGENHRVIHCMACL